MARGRAQTVGPSTPRRSRSRSRSRGHTPAGGGSGIITNQKDFYQKRSVANRSKSDRRLKAFAEKVEKALHFTDEAHHILENTSSANNINRVDLPITSNTQTIYASDAIDIRRDLRIGIFGNDASGIRRALNEVYNRVASHIPGIATASVTPSLTVKPLQSDYNSYQFLVKSIHATVVFKNVQAGSLMVDVYECVNTSDINNSNYSTAFRAWNSIPGADGFFPSATTGQFGADAIEFTRTAITDAGATPYHMANFLKYWKIMKKTRVQLELNELFNYEYNYVPKGKSFTVGDDISGTTGFLIKKGHAKDLIIVVNPTFNDNTAAATQALNIQWTKNYFLRLPHYEGQKHLMMKYSYA